MKLYYCFILLASCNFQVHGVPKQIHFEPFIERMEDRLENLVTPSPETITEIITQIQGTCQGNLTTDMEPRMESMSICMNELFNMTELIVEIREAVPKGELDVIFGNICLKWSRMKNCMKDGMDAVNECWGNETKDQIMRGMDTIVLFFCGEQNDGAKIALFIAEEGLTCIEQSGEKIGNCFIEQISDLDKLPATSCMVLGYFFNCLPIMKNCSDVTPENLISSLVVEMGRVMGCAHFPPPSYVFPNSKASQELDTENEHESNNIGIGFQNILPQGIVAGLNFKGALDFVTNNCSSLTEFKPEVDHLMKVTQPCHNLVISNELFVGTGLSDAKSRVKAVCTKILEAFDCILPHVEFIKQCSPENYVGVFLMKEFCKQDGATKIINLITLSNTGEQCFNANLTLMSGISNCINRHHPPSPKDHDLPFFAPQNLKKHFCWTLSLTRHCILESLTKDLGCSQSQALLLEIRHFLTDVESKDPLVKPCIHYEPPLLSVKGAAATTYYSSIMFPVALIAYMLGNYVF